MAKTDTARIDRAQKALREFRTMQPRLTAYARAVTGRRDLRVEATGDAPHTDGRDIFFRPPIALADDIKHDRKSCDKRDPGTLLQRCAACAVREEILVTMYHEIAHVAYHSFAPFTDSDRKQAILKGISLKGDAYGQAMNAKLNTFQQQNLGNTYMALAQAISEFLPDLVNITEDIRIDEKMYAARKGIRRMREGRARRAFTEGVEGPDGVMRVWSEAPLNSQFVVAMYAKAAGFQMEGYFHPMVLAAYESTTLAKLCDDAKVARSASDAFNIAFDVLVEGKKLGFFAEDADPPPEQQPEPEDQQSEEKQDPTASSPDNEPDNDEQSSEPDQGETDEEKDDESQSDGGSAEPEQNDSENDSQDGGEAPDSTPEEDEGEPDSSEEEGDDTESSSESRDDSDSESAEQEGHDNDSSGDMESEDEHEPGDAHDEGADPEGTGGSVQSGEQETVGGEEVDGQAKEDSPTEESATEDASEADKAETSGSSDDSATSNSSGNDPQAGESSDPSDGVGRDEDIRSELEQQGDRQRNDTPKTDSVRGESDSEPSDDDDGLLDEAEGEGEGDVEPVDSGEYAEEGVYEDDTPVMGGSGEISEYLEAVTGHHGDHEAEAMPGVSVADSKAMARAILAGAYFEKPPQHVSSVNVRRYDNPSRYYEDAWRGQNGGYIDAPPGYRGGYPASALKRVGIRCDTNVDESVLGPALQQTRRAFNDNARAKHQRNLKSGRVNGPSLAKRAPFGDPRMFKRTILPGKKSYSVLIGIDISGSTVGKNIVLAKRAAKAQAELCQRAGIDFAVYAHTADGDDGGDLSLEIYEIKGFREQWNDKAKLSLDNIGSFAHNLDGHTIEYYRNLISRESTTNKIILYYTDGKMPAANYREELEVLQDQIKHCKRQGIELMGVGIRTDSPTKHGLDTVRVDNDSDLVKVIAHLEKKLVNR